MLSTTRREIKFRVTGTPALDHKTPRKRGFIGVPPTIYLTLRTSDVYTGLYPLPFV